MKEKKLTEFGEWLNTQGHCIDLKDDFWMEEYDWGEHKTKDIIQLINDYHTEQLFLNEVSITLPNYWQKRCELAEKYIAESPCDPDIYKEQWEAWSKWLDFKKIPND